MRPEAGCRRVDTRPIFLPPDVTMRGYVLRSGRCVGFTPDGRTLHPIIHKHMGGYGYLIDRDTAEQVLVVAPDVPMPIDRLLFHVVNLHIARHARPLRVVPGTVQHRPFERVGSDIHIRTNGWVKSPRPVWKPNRIVFLNRMLLIAWALMTGGHRTHVPFEG